MKRVGIDFHVVDGIFQGSRSHVLEIFSRVFKLCPGIEFYLFLEGVDRLKEWSPAYSLPNVKLVHMPHANPIKRLCVQLPLFQKRLSLDLLHTQYVSPLPSFSKTVVTLHDILFETHPQYFGRFFNLRSRLLMRSAAARATHIFTVSEYSKSEIASKYRVQEDRITVIHNAADQQRFKPGAAGVPTVEAAGLKAGAYLLTVGRLEPRKNHVSLIDAYAQLGVDLPLVIIGQRHFGYQQIEKRIRDLGLSGRVRLLENISDADLAAFYRHAKVFVYPTWAEGFGMPVIEAMSCGVPVITSATTSLPEIAEGAGILVNPADVPGLRDAMARVLACDAFARELGEKGRLRAGAFRWDQSADKVRRVYEAILNE